MKTLVTALLLKMEGFMRADLIPKGIVMAAAFVTDGFLIIFPHMGLRSSGCWIGRDLSGEKATLRAPVRGRR